MSEPNTERAQEARGSRRRSLLWYLLCASIVLFSLAWAGFDFHRWTRTPFKGYSTSEKVLDVLPGTSATNILHYLDYEGLVDDLYRTRFLLMLSGKASELKAGEYRFTEAMTPMEVLNRLTEGGELLRPLKIPEGLTLQETAAAVEEQGFFSAEEFLRVATDPAPILDLDPEASDLEGYLFPDTYYLAKTTTSLRLVEMMLERFRRLMAAYGRDIARERGLTMREVVTLASLIEEECRLDEERPVVAAVFLNRLELEMLLQCDPTVIYALKKAGRYDGRLTRDIMDIDSPYNTYRYGGLPPGPIANPGRASILAVFEPADTDALYFVARNDGSHEFTKTNAEHIRAVRKYRRGRKG